MISPLKRPVAVSMLSAQPKDRDFFGAISSVEILTALEDIPKTCPGDTASKLSAFAIALFQRFDFCHPAMMALFVGIFCR